MKKCNTCKTKKSLEEFSLHKGQKDGHQSICKECAKTTVLKYYYNNSESRKEYARNARLKKPKICRLCKTSKERCEYNDRDNTCKLCRKNPKNIKINKREKICKKCKINKSIEDFGGKYNQDQKCISCKNPPKKLKDPNEKCIICKERKKQKNENICAGCSAFWNYYQRKLYLTSMLGGKCSNCNLDNIICLDFHHINPEEKEFTIGSQGVFRSLEDLENEIQKCKLLCANCHRLEHSGFRQAILDYFNRPIDTVRKRETSKEYIPKPEYRKVKRPSKEELEKLVWEKPSLEIGPIFGVSDRMIGKWCQYYNITKPPRGYWAKKRSKIMSNYISYEK